MSEATFDTAAKHIDNATVSNGSAAPGVFEGMAPALGEAARATADAIRVAARKTSSVISDLGDGAPATREAVTNRVREQPVTALLIAVGLGMLAGMMAFRR